MVMWFSGSCVYPPPPPIFRDGEEEISKNSCSNLPTLYHNNSFQTRKICSGVIIFMTRKVCSGVIIFMTRKVCSGVIIFMTRKVCSGVIIFMTRKVCSGVIIFMVASSLSLFLNYIFEK